MTEIKKFASPDINPGGLTWNGKYLVLGGAATEIISTLNRKGEQVKAVDTHPVPYDPGSYAFDGKYSLTNNQVGTSVDLVDGDFNKKKTFTEPGTHTMGGAYDGKYFIICDDETNKVYFLDRAGTIIRTIDSPVSAPTGVEWDGKYLNIASETSDIYVIDRAGSVVKTFSPPNGANLVSLAHDGKYFWAGKGLAFPPIVYCFDRA